MKKTFHFKNLSNKDKKSICQTVWVFGLINFFIFWFSSMYFGGTSELGYIENGFYYVGEQNQYSQVPFWFYYFNLIQNYSLFLTHPLSAIAFIYSKKIEPYKRKIIR